MSLSNKIKRFIELPYFEKKYFLQGVLARAVSVVFYRRQFGAIGAGGWLKPPRQVVSPKNIFIGDKVRIESGAILYSVGRYGDKEYGGKILIGDGVYINHGFNASCAHEISIGDSVACGPNVFLCDFDHGYEDPAVGMIESPLVSKGPIKIGARSWLGANVYVGSGVELGEHCTVAANSVVTKSFPANSVIAGVPARMIKTFDSVEQRWVRA